MGHDLWLVASIIARLVMERNNLSVACERSREQFSMLLLERYVVGPYFLCLAILGVVVFLQLVIDVVQYTSRRIYR